MGASLRPSNFESEKLSSTAKYITSGSNKTLVSVLDVLKRSCLGQGRVKKSQMISTEKMVIGELTLEDWLTSSPGSNPEGVIGGGGGELQVFKQISKRVCTSSRRVYADFTASRPAGDSSVMEKLVKPDDAGEANWLNAFAAAIDRCQSGNLKKKVSFRLPEESDVFVFSHRRRKKH